MKKLSAIDVQKKLVEADSQAKPTYKNPAKQKGPGEAGKPLDTSTRITNIKQVEIPGGKPSTSGGKDGSPFVKEADFAGTYTDKMSSGIFTTKSHTDSGPSTPKVEKLKPNQTTKLSPAKPDMSRTKGAKETPAPHRAEADRADAIVDRMPHAIFTNNGGKGIEVSVPSSKNLNATTRPTSKEVKPNLTRDPKDTVKSPAGPSGTQPKPSDSPSKPKWEKVKSGVLVRVNENIKARFGIVSDGALRKLVESYKAFGYPVTIETGANTAWKTDKTLHGLVRESIEAKHNDMKKAFESARVAAVKRFYNIVKTDYNGFYDSPKEFSETVQAAFSRIEEIVENKYLSAFDVYSVKARIMDRSGMSDVEMISSAANPEMALRKARGAVMEQFGVGVKLVHVFVDGKKYLPNQIKEWKSVR